MFYVIVPPLLSSLDQKWVYTLCLCVPLRQLRVLIQQRWRCPWWGCLQCGSWSTLYLSRERATPAGRLWNSNYNTTALMVRNKGPITVSVSFEKALDSSVSNDIVMLWCVTDVVSWPEVERLFRQSVFESMPLTSLDEKGVLLNAPGPLGALEPAHQQPATIFPWDNPLSYAKQQLHSLRTKGLLLHSLVQLCY